MRLPFVWRAPDQPDKTALDIWAFQLDEARFSWKRGELKSFPEGGGGGFSYKYVEEKVKMHSFDIKPALCFLFFILVVYVRFYFTDISSTFLLMTKYKQFA